MPSNTNRAASTYELAAQSFLMDTGAKLSVRFIGKEKHFSNDKEPRHVWEFRLSRGRRSYTSRFGNSIAAMQELEKKMRLLKDYEATQAETINKHRAAKILDPLKTWQPAGSEHCPTAYDILACLQVYEPPATIDDLAADFGITKPSEAIRIFESLHKEHAALTSLFTDEELERLASIN